MPVVIAGAPGAVSQGLIQHLARGGGEVRAVVTDRVHADPMRALGAKVATTRSLTDGEALAAVLRDAHTLCFLPGMPDLDPDAYEAEVARPAEVLAGVAEDAGIRRALVWSSPAADPASGNALFAALGRAEEAFAGLGADTLVIRCGPVLTDGEPWYEALRGSGRVVRVPGTGAQRVAPVSGEALITALVAADDRRETVTGTYGLAQEETTMDELAARVAGRGPKVHLRPRGPSRLLSPWGPVLLEALASDLVPREEDLRSVLRIHGGPAGPPS